MTDVQPTPVRRHEQRALESARTHAGRHRVHTADEDEAQRIASTHQETLQDSVSVALQLLGSAQQSLNQLNVSTYLEGLDIGHLQTCLTGVQHAYGQIAAHDNDQAAQTSQESRRPV